MRSGKTFEMIIEYIRECSGAAELTVRLLQFNCEPTVVDLKACTYCGEVFSKRVYLSYLMRVSPQELRRFAEHYLS